MTTTPPASPDPAPEVAPAAPAAPAAALAAAPSRFAIPDWAKIVGVVVGMGASSIAGVETGSASLESRLAVLETKVITLEADNSRLEQALDRLDQEHSEGVQDVLCAISDAHGKGFPGCGVRGRL
jgi:hypothetical protein